MLAFSAETRRHALERMAERELDLLVVGGGITGAGIALDAASRGFRVAMVERDDFASGTSGRSSRLIHGGIRYLERFQLGVVMESLRERRILLRLAPHLIRPIAMHVPARRGWRREALRLGLIAYDAMALGRNVGRHRRVSEEEMERAGPGLGSPASGFAYFECVTDDARLTLEIARTASSFGALVANHARVESLLGDGRIRGAVVTDATSGERFEVRAAITANATGVWADEVVAMADEGPARLRPSKGIHVVFRPGAVKVRTGFTVGSAAHDGRFVFIVPWADRAYAGTTDTPYAGDLAEPPVTEEDLDYVIAAVARSFPGVIRADVVASWAGLRPLLGTGGGPTEDLSRKHAIFEDPTGLLTITGGKLTAYRSMAEELVDAVAERLRRKVAARTRSIPIGLHAPVLSTLGRAASEAERAGLDPDAGRRMVYRFGDDWEEALARIRSDPSLGEPIVDGLPVLRVEVELARDREMALTDDDVLVRRTRLTTLDASASFRSGGLRS